MISEIVYSVVMYQQNVFLLLIDLNYSVMYLVELLKIVFVIVYDRLMFIVCIFGGNILVLIRLLIDVQKLMIVSVIVISMNVVIGFVMFFSVCISGIVLIIVNVLNRIIDVWWLILFDSVLNIGCISMQMSSVMVIMLLVVFVCMLVVFMRYFCMYVVNVQKISELLVVKLIIVKNVFLCCYMLWIVFVFFLLCDVFVDVLLSDLCRYSEISVVVVLIMNGMCQFYVFSLLVDSVCCRIMSISSVYSWLLISVMYWNDVKKL